MWSRSSAYLRAVSERLPTFLVRCKPVTTFAVFVLPIDEPPLRVFMVDNPSRAPTQLKFKICFDSTSPMINPSSGERSYKALSIKLKRSGFSRISTSFSLRSSEISSV